MSMAVGEFALFDQAKHAISVTTLVLHDLHDATCNTHAPNIPVWTRQETGGKRLNE